jgi:DNA repair exonuclease SbcCD ATPase subunit
MILFQKVRWKNLLSTGDVWTEINFTKSKSTLIVGENGAGKSTILDAVCFGLFGKPFRKINKPQLVNSINRKGMLIELEFKIGHRQYLIRRGQKPSVFEILQDGNIINQNSEAREYQDYLETNILKLNFKSFQQIVILGSASFTPFMQLPASHRREIIEDLLDIQIFSTMNSLLKDKITINRTSLYQVDYEIKGSAEKIELYKKHIESLKQNNDEIIAQKQAQIDGLNIQINDANSSVGTINVEIQTLSTSIEDHSKVLSKSSKFALLSRQLDSKLDKLKKEIEFFHESDDCPTCRQGIAHEHKSEIVEKNHKQVADIESGKEKLLTEIAEVDTRLTEITNINTQITLLNRKVTDHLIHIQMWGDMINSINKEISNLKTNNKQIDTNTEELKVLKEQLKAALQSKEDLTKEKAVLDVASVLLKDSGVKTKIIKQYIPVINKLVNKYLAAMDFFVAFELNENFEETIKSRHRDDFSYESFSEGEKMRIDLALLFTWRAVSKLRNSASTNLLIMDEVFDSSLDNNGTEEFLKIIGTLTTDTNLFIISHKGDQLFDKFHSLIKFEKHKNFSRISK